MMHSNKILLNEANFISMEFGQIKTNCVSHLMHVKVADLTIASKDQEMGHAN